MTYCEEPKRYRRLKTLVPVVKLKKGGGKENTPIFGITSLFERLEQEDPFLKIKKNYWGLKAIRLVVPTRYCMF